MGNNPPRFRPRWYILLRSNLRESDYMGVEMALDPRVTAIQEKYVLLKDQAEQAYPEARIDFHGAVAKEVCALNIKPDPNCPNAWYDKSDKKPIHEATYTGSGGSYCSLCGCNATWIFFEHRQHLVKKDV